MQQQGGTAVAAAARTHLLPAAVDVRRAPTRSSRSHHDVARVKAGGLARRRAVGRLGELQRHPPAPVLGDRARQRARAVAQADGVDLRARAVQPRAAHLHLAREQVRARADGDRVGARVGGEHVERLGRGEPDPLALADREAVVAAVAAEHAPAAVDDLPRALARAAVAGEERGAPVPARKQRSWESALEATGSSASAASARTSGLVSSPSGKRMRAIVAGLSAHSM